MGKLAKTYAHTSDAVSSFEQAISMYDKWKHSIDKQKVENLNIDYEDMLISLRDSAIQRFEYSIDLLWKYLKTYLDDKLKIVPDILSPTNIIRETGKTRIITEHETHVLLEMIRNRNLTSHIYKQEYAEIISRQLPEFLKIMQSILSKTTP